jgi:hypothetical protein
VRIAGAPHCEPQRAALYADNLEIVVGELRGTAYPFADFAADAGNEDGACGSARLDRLWNRVARRRRFASRFKLPSTIPCPMNRRAICWLAGPLFATGADGNAQLPIRLLAFWDVMARVATVTVAGTEVAQSSRIDLAISIASLPPVG